MIILTTLQHAWVYFLSHTAEFWQAFGDHLELVGIALGVALVLGLPLGIWTARSRQASRVVMSTVNGLRVLPSLAVLFLVVPYLGLSTASAAVALIFLALPPVVINTDAAFRSLDPAILEAAQGMGMDAQQSLVRVQFPLALPVILTGIRTAAVEVIASATLAAFVGSGGLGIYVTRGFALYDYAILMVGAIPVALLSLVAEGVFIQLQHWSEPPRSG
jgi:osmoprotectant transport system permease protein